MSTKFQQGYCNFNRERRATNGAGTTRQSHAKERSCTSSLYYTQKLTSNGS